MAESLVRRQDQIQSNTAFRGARLKTAQAFDHSKSSQHALCDRQKTRYAPLAYH
jgi:hypothetical protein